MRISNYRSRARAVRHPAVWDRSTKHDCMRMARARLAGRFALIVGMAILFTAGCAAPARKPTPEHNAALQVERTDREFDLGKDIQRVSIVNSYGTITVKGQDENAVGIHAVIQRLAPTFAPLRLHVRREGGTLHIEVGYAKGVDPATRGRLDMAVFVPGAEALALTTGADRIKVGRRNGSIQATTTSGEIVASSRGRLELQSDSGQIRAVALGRRWSGISRIRTASGRIIMGVPTFAGITLDASSGGKLSTNFGLTVHKRPGGGGSAHARYGDGHSRLVVTSASGEVVLEQVVLLGEDDKLPEDDD